MMETTGSIRREMTVEADAATVFAFFTDPQRLIRWMGVSAELDPRPGGLFLIDVTPGFVASERKCAARFVADRDRSAAEKWQYVGPLHAQRAADCGSTWAYRGLDSLSRTFGHRSERPRSRSRSPSHAAMRRIVFGMSEAVERVAAQKRPGIL